MRRIDILSGHVDEHRPNLLYRMVKTASKQSTFQMTLPGLVASGSETS